MRIKRNILIFGIILMMAGVASAEVENVSEDSFIWSSYPTTNFDSYCSEANCYEYAGSGAKILLNFENKSNFAGKTVYLNVYITDYYGNTLNISKITSSWSAGTVTWNTKPTTSYLRDFTFSGSGGNNNISLSGDDIADSYGIAIEKSIGADIQLEILSKENGGVNIPYIFYSISTLPSITSWSNNKTNNDSLDISVYTTDYVNFNATANQTITTWSWFKNDVNQSNNFDNFTTNFTAGNHTINVNATNTNGTSNTVTWNVTATIPTITVSCPVGYCFLAMNYTNKTLQQLDDLQTNDTIQGWYNSAAQKYELHRTGYNYNQNVNVTQKWGFLYYFTKATNVTLSYTSVPSINLNTGWNLVGNMNTNARTLGELKTSIGVNATSAKYYNRTTGSWATDNATSVPVMESFFVYTNGSVAWSG